MIFYIIKNDFTFHRHFFDCSCEHYTILFPFCLVPDEETKANTRLTVANLVFGSHLQHRKSCSTNFDRTTRTVAILVGSDYNFGQRHIGRN